MTFPIQPTRRRDPAALLRTAETLAVSAAGAIAGGLLAASTAVGQLHVGQGTRYAPGATVTSVAAGVSFRIPEGVEARMDAELGLFVLQGEGIDAAVWAYSEGSLDELGAVMADDLGQLGISAREDRVERGAERGVERVRASFEAVSERGPGRLIAELVRGTPGNVLGVAALGGRDREAALGSLVDAVVASVQWSDPAARTLSAQAAGALLQATSGGSDYASGGAGGYGSSASEGSTDLHLCRDGSYGYVSERTTYVSIEGASASSEHRDAHQGRWLLVGDVAGKVWLALAPTDREAIVWEVKLAGDGTATVDGRRYAVGDAGC